LEARAHLLIVLHDQEPIIRSLNHVVVSFVSQANWVGGSAMSSRSAAATGGGSVTHFFIAWPLYRGG